MCDGRRGSGNLISQLNLVKKKKYNCSTVGDCVHDSKRGEIRIRVSEQKAMYCTLGV